MATCSRKYRQATDDTIGIRGNNMFSSVAAAENKRTQELMEIADQAFFRAVDFLQDRGIDPADITITFKIREDEN